MYISPISLHFTFKRRFFLEGIVTFCHGLKHFKDNIESSLGIAVALLSDLSSVCDGKSLQVIENVYIYLNTCFFKKILSIFDTSKYGSI